jgi:hypothetical protein
MLSDQMPPSLFCIFEEIIPHRGFEKFVRLVELYCERSYDIESIASPLKKIASTDSI